MRLEQALREQEARVDELLAAAGRYVAALKRWQRACREGHLGNRRKAAQQAAELAPGLAAPTAEADAAWDFDLDAYLAGDDWRDELCEVALDAYGLRTFEEDNGLVSFPVIVRAAPARGVLTLGRMAWAKLHPRQVAAELKRLREQSQAGNARELLRSLAQVQRQSPHPERPLRLADAYRQFLLAPGWKRDNSRADFALAIHALATSGLTELDGMRFELERPTGDPRAGDVFEVVDPEGRLQRYYAITFHRSEP